MTDSGRSYQQFFAELKRRKVFRVMTAYGVIGFGVIEAASPGLQAPGTRCRGRWSDWLAEQNAARECGW